MLLFTKQRRRRTVVGRQNNAGVVPSLISRGGCDKYGSDPSPFLFCQRPNPRPISKSSLLPRFHPHNPNPTWPTQQRGPGRMALGGRGRATTCRAGQQTKQEDQAQHVPSHHRLSTLVDVPCATASAHLFSLSLSLASPCQWPGRRERDLPKSYMQQRTKSARLGCKMRRR